MSEAAVERFRKLSAADPGNALFRFPLARALADAGRWHEAVPELRTCAASKADWMAPRILLGRALAETGDPVGARRALEEALALALAQQHEEPEAEIRALLAALGGAAPPGHLQT